ncbi:MAG: hypothetical protein Q9213_003497 [Squamulea squamosa]
MSFAAPVAPVAPDMERCFKYFNQAANINDCRHALNMLPGGTEPVLWKNGPAYRGDRYALPFHVVSGTCEIIFQTSGPAATQVMQISFSGDQIRSMAGRVLNQCIVKPGPDQGGGYITRSFKKLLDSITLPGNQFFEHFPASSTFLTLMIWNRTAHVEKGNFPYNPGNQDQILTEEVEEQLYRAGKRWGRGSAQRAELEKRQDAVAYALSALDGAERNTPNWFDFYPAPRVCRETDVLEVGLETSNCTTVTKATKIPGLSPFYEYLPLELHEGGTVTSDPRPTVMARNGYGGDWEEWGEIEYPHTICYKPVLFSMDPSPVAHCMPSPTLTNPDMILPDDSHANQYPSSQQISGSSTLPQWHDSSTITDSQMRSAVRNLFGNGHRLRHRNSEKALKTQETLDIRPQSKQSELSQRSTNSALASSPLLHEEFGAKSMGGPLPRDEPNDNWDALDDGSVISESVSPLVEAERDSHMMSDNGGLDGYRFSDGFRKAIDEEDDESYSHAAMSVRAEEILANAKKRLTEMENNLSRARHTVNRPSSSMSSFNTNGTESQSLYTLPKTQSPSKHRQQNSPPSSSSSKGHSRVFSETSVPSSMQTSPRNGDGRTVAAHNINGMSSTVTNAPANTTTKQGSESRDWFWAGLTRNPSHSAARHNNYGLQPLNEDGPPPSTFESPERDQSPIEEEILDITPAAQEANDSTPEQDNGLTRARSTNQMRDIRDQMQDLKGKISSLKQRAREDSLRRRSLQSMRTPSPFTAAEQWYTNNSGYNRDRSRSRPRERSPPTAQPRIEEEDGTEQYPVQAPDPEMQEELLTNVDEEARHMAGIQHVESCTGDSIARDNDESPRTVIDGSSTESDEVAVETPLDEPLVLAEENGVDGEIEDGDEGIHDSVALPRHEDRPDAFDYEHLFLHSGMGTLGQGRKRRNSSSSHSSTYSVETTKPSRVSTGTADLDRDSATSLGDDEVESSAAQHGAHARKGSVDSVSTVATFATATEGERNGESDTDEEEWVYKRPMAGSWEPEYPSHPNAELGKQDGQQTSTDMSNHAPQARSPPHSKTQGGDITPSAVDVLSAKSAETGMADLLGFLTNKLPCEDGSTASRPIELSDSDKELAEKLVRSVAKVCAQLQAFSTEGNKYGGRPWRRRLDGARRVLDGETNGEVF